MNPLTSKLYHLESASGASIDWTWLAIIDYMRSKYRNMHSISGHKVALTSCLYKACTMIEKDYVILRNTGTKSIAAQK